MTSPTPFDRYLQHPIESDPYSQNYDSNDRQESPIQFQMPQFMMFGPPTLAPGGGAEVMPPGMFSGAPSEMGSSWINNNIYSSNSPEQSNPPVSRYTTMSSLMGGNENADSVSMFPHPGIDFALGPYGPGQTDAGDLATNLTLPFAAPSAFGLPVYSTSGFDLLSIMARVATRPNPTLTLGPVDMSCSFVIVDVRRYDSPVVYASPTFCALTGYEEHEVVGRNCRFLQAPDGNVQKGEERRFTSTTAVSHLRKCLISDKECQTSMINYKKGGTAFINLVSVIPIPGGISNALEEADQIAYHIGFQVDLTEQPNAILDRVRGGTYVVNYSHNHVIRNPINPISRDRRPNTSSVIPLSKSLRSLLADEKFTNSISLSISTTSIQSAASGEKSSTADSFDGNQYLSMLLLESSPDFIHVLSLRGSFLYVAPSVRRVLGYDPEDVVGKSISDYCHPADLVPLMRELKESSATPSQEGQASAAPPRSVDLLFRIMSKSDGYVWMESRGRLYVEPGKGRKAIILSGRKRAMPELTWGHISRTGGLVLPRRNSQTGAEEGGDRAFWGVLNHTGTFLFVGEAIRDVLGWSQAEMIGKRLDGFVITSPNSKFNPIQGVKDAFHRATTISNSEYSQMPLDMLHKDGSAINITAILYHCADPSTDPPEPIICHFKRTDAIIHSTHIMHHSASEVFEEMDTCRNTSWQYELQQLKFANQRLTDEVQALESRNKRTHAPSHVSHSYTL